MITEGVRSIVRESSVDQGPAPSFDVLRNKQELVLLCVGLQVVGPANFRCCVIHEPVVAFDTSLRNSIGGTPVEAQLCTYGTDGVENWQLAVAYGSNAYVISCKSNGGAIMITNRRVEKCKCESGHPRLHGWEHYRDGKAP